MAPHCFKQTVDILQIMRYYFNGCETQHGE